MRNTIRYFTTSHPNTAAHIENTKTALGDGRRIALRKDKTAIWVRQGPDTHRRANAEEVALSSVEAGGERIELTKQIDRRKFLYIVKTGEDHLADSPLRPYQYHPVEKAKYKASSLQKVGAVVSTASPSGARALFYGGCLLAFQHIWWLTCHLSWIRHPSRFQKSSFSQLSLA